MTRHQASVPAVAATVVHPIGREVHPDGSTATRELAGCGCTWVVVIEPGDRFVTAVESCPAHQH